MGIVGENRFAGGAFSGAHHPTVAGGDGERQARSLQRLMKLPQHAGESPVPKFLRTGENRGCIGVIAGKKLARPLFAQPCGHLRIYQLTVPGKTQLEAHKTHKGDRVGDLPRLRLKIQNGKLHRKAIAIRRKICIYPFCKCLQRQPGFRGQRGGNPFGGPVKPQSPEKPILAEHFVAKNFAEPPGYQTAEKLHLPEPIAGAQEAGGSVKIGIIFRIHMRHAIIIEIHGHRLTQDRNDLRTIQIRQRFGNQPESQVTGNAHHHRK